MKRIQISHNVLNKALFKEIRFSLVSIGNILLLLGVSIVCLGFAYVDFSQQSTLLGTVMLGLAILAFGWIFYSAYTKYKNVTESFKEIDDIVYAISFGNDGLSVQNCYLGSHTKIPYSKLKRIKETKSTYTLFAGSDQFVMIRKDCLKITSKEFIDYLKSKDTHIKIWPKV